AAQLVAAAPLSPAHPHEFGVPNRASHLVVSQAAHSEGVVLHIASQPAPYVVAATFGGSHCSPGALTLPSPQVGAATDWQVALHVVPLGGSHCSPASTTPLPQTAPAGSCLLPHAVTTITTATAAAIATLPNDAPILHFMDVLPV